ncbi:MAG: GGDEF domain-containing protein [Halioglobus sp.]|nr:GGDEF domain-containing protein [Halioglobus sp.]MBP6724122.1 GGDEF domain-containing protein [Halioglobus sp.]
MESIVPGTAAFMLFGLIFAITCAQMLVVYVLAESSKPPAGLGLHTVYFMASLLGWIALTLELSADLQMAVNIPSMMLMLTSYILFMAAGQRAGIVRGRVVLGAVCLVACLCEFFLPPSQMFLVQGAVVTVFFAATGLIYGWRSAQQRNAGDAIITCSALMMALGMPVAMYYFAAAGAPARGEAIALGVYSVAYALVAIGFLASVLIEYQQHLSSLTTLDPLTRLLNRRGLEEALLVSMAQAARRGSPTSAIMVDIDHFKQVNDSFGQETGDQLLRQVAEILKRMSRSSDVVARTGGEEFLLVLPETELDSARLLAERIRLAIGERPLVVDSQRIGVTASLGVACIVGQLNLDDLSLEADRAMYLAKRGGRNRVASVEHKPVHLTSPLR